LELGFSMAHKVVTGLIIYSEWILLGQRSQSRAIYPGVWNVFSGHMEPGEQHELILVHELQEEPGIKPTRWGYLKILHVLEDQWLCDFSCQNFNAYED
jgi:NADH pyrophosphatase NudC (nudix superfamily)